MRPAQSACIGESGEIRGGPLVAGRVVARVPPDKRLRI
jgi:hypothetical protein